MKRFSFSLQSLRTLREQKEQLAQQRYAEAVRAVSAVERRVAETLAELESCWSWLRQQLTAEAFARRLESTHAYCAVLGTRWKREEAELRAEQVRLNEAWEAMMQATRDRETLDRCYERKRRTYDRLARQEEQKTMDEVGGRLARGAGIRGSFVHMTLEVK